jgi:hypothetical protein
MYRMSFVDIQDLKGEKMKVFVQWTTDKPDDWTAINAEDWAYTAQRPQPVGGEDINSQPGYIHRVCIQGMSSSGDHHSVRMIGDDVELTSWTDDPDDEPSSRFYDPRDPIEWWYHAQVIRFRPLAPDPELGGAINTNITRVVYGGKKYMEYSAQVPLQGVVFKPWEEFVLPNPDVTRHGIWVPDALDLEHCGKTSLADWRQWGQHLDPIELEEETGLLKSQFDQGRFKPKQGTRTQFLRDTDRISAVHAVPTGTENAMSATAGASETEASPNLTASSDALCFAWTSDSTFPNDANWPNGIYECQTDCTNVDTNVSYGLLTLGGSAGHFANVNSGLTAENETWTQDESAFTTSGLNMASNTIDPAAGNASDRFEVLVAGARSAGCHGNRTFTIRYSSDSFARGPWVEASGPSIPIAMYHHMHHNNES